MIELTSQCVLPANSTFGAAPFGAVMPVTPFAVAVPDAKAPVSRPILVALLRPPDNACQLNPSSRVMVREISANRTRTLT